jgi:hypothetical protein
MLGLESGIDTWVRSYIRHEALPGEGIADFDSTCSLEPREMIERVIPRYAIVIRWIGVYVICGVGHFTATTSYLLCEGSQDVHKRQMFGRRSDESIHPAYVYR